MPTLRKCQFLICLLILIVPGSIGDDSKSYTAKERQLIKNLYEIVKGNLTQDIMHEDKYLVRFLRAQDHDVEAAAAMIQRNLVWRKEMQINTILKEDWSKWESIVPYYVDVFDREGRPALLGGIGSLDLRKFLVSKQEDNMHRYIVRALEHALHHLHNYTKQTGQEFTDGHLLFNLAGFNTRSHACITCIPQWLTILFNYERYYPRLATSIIGINAPRTFYTIVESVRPILSHHSLQVSKIYDYDKSIWSTELLQMFPEDHLPIEFGGTAHLSPAKIVPEYLTKKI